MNTRTLSNNTESAGEPPIQSFASFLRAIGREAVTGWRWRKSGMIQTVNICGHQYITREAILEFKRRAVAGEFSRIHPTPQKRKSAS